MQNSESPRSSSPRESSAEPQARIRDAASLWLAANGEAQRQAMKVALDAEVVTAVTEMRAQGWPPEKVVLRVKSAVREACISAPRVPRASEIADAIVSEAVTRSISEYYRGAFATSAS